MLWIDTFKKFQIWKKYISAAYSRDIFISEQEVLDCSKIIQPNKAVGPDGMSDKMLLGTAGSICILIQKYLIYPSPRQDSLATGKKTNVIFLCLRNVNKIFHKITGQYLLRAAF